jgi:hypothetical protein
MPQRESAIVGRNNVRAQVTGQEELLVKVNSIDPNAELNVNVHDALGNDITSTVIGATTGLDVNIIGSVTLEVDVLTAPGTFAEDTAHASGNTGAFVLGVRNDSNTAMTSANGDYSPVAVNSAGAVAIQDGGNSITVDGGTGVSRTPTILRTSANSTVAAGTYSMSFASVGTVNATVGGQTLKPGETINFDAGAINNTLGSVAYDSSAVGAELLIITLT